MATLTVYSLPVLVYLVFAFLWHIAHSGMSPDPAAVIASWSPGDQAQIAAALLLGLNRLVFQLFFTTTLSAQAMGFRIERRRRATNSKA